MGLGCGESFLEFRVQIAPQGCVEVFGVSLGMQILRTPYLRPGNDG